MNRHIRRAAIGLAAGLAASALLVATMNHTALAVALGAAVGVGHGLAFLLTRRAYADRAMTAAAPGIALWAVVAVIALPLLTGSDAHWMAPQMRALFPQLVGWTLYGATLGLVSQAIHDLVTWKFGPETPAPAPEPVVPTRVVILGGGFAGMATAQNLERCFGAARDVQIVLVSETNALLFTPMLAEVAGSSLEPTHISSPLRTSLHRTRVLRGQVTAVDLASKQVTVCVEGKLPGHDDEPETTHVLAYDHLVFSLGARSTYRGMDNVERLAFDFKTLMDAMKIRNHVIDMLERADHESDPERRAALLTFVIAGGGFAGVELAGALNDFCRGVLADYPNLSPDDLKIVLLHSRDRILPELSRSLAVYAQEKMAARGVIFQLEARLADARPGVVCITRKNVAPDQASGEIRSFTLVWTAGNQPNPLLATLPVDRDRRDAIIVESTMAVPDHPGLWAIGDNAALKDGITGEPCPPTAQFALRQGAQLARNIHRTIRGKDLEPFHFKSLGSMCVVGHHVACAELSVPLSATRKIRFSGLMAWLMWRAIYVSKLPGMERRVRVVIDWIIELFFPRDIVQTIDFD